MQYAYRSKSSESIFVDTFGASPTVLAAARRAGCGAVRWGGTGRLAAAAEQCAYRGGIGRDAFTVSVGISLLAALAAAAAAAATGHAAECIQPLVESSFSDRPERASVRPSVAASD